MPPKMHAMDLLADDIAHWIEAMSTDVVDALTEGGIAPFAANVDSKEKLAFFTSQVYLPDGSINVAGRDKLMAQYGPDGYAAIMRTILKSMGGMPPIPTNAFAAPGQSALPATTLPPPPPPPPPTPPTDGTALPPIPTGPGG